MNTKNLFYILITLMFLFLFQSCKKETARPVIQSIELGLDNSKIAYAGGDFHIEAEVEAEAKISTITIEIHPEGEHDDKSSFTVYEEHWEVDSTYTKFSALRNTTFHEHLDVPLDAELGHYHVHFIVTDMDGYQTTYEDEIELKLPDDTEAPVLTVSSSPASGQSFTSGQTIVLSGNVTDNISLGGLYVGLVRVNQNLADADVSAANTITMLHSHDFEGQAAHQFSCSIVVGAGQDNNNPPKTIAGDFAWTSGEYYILVKAKDAIGSNWAFSQKYLLNIEL